MDDGRPYMWTHFMMEDEMLTIVILPLVEGSSSFVVVAPPLVQLSIVKQCQKRKRKWVMMKQMFEGDGVMLFLLTSLICMKKSKDVLTNLVYHSKIGHTFALNTIVNCWMNVVTKKNNFIF